MNRSAERGLSSPRVMQQTEAIPLSARRSRVAPAARYEKKEQHRRLGSAATQLPREGNSVEASSNGTSPTPRVEVVTSTFVASGVPAGARDLDRFLETLNNPAVGKQIMLEQATVRPLYRAASPLALEAPILVRRSDIIFANFEGPAGEGDRLDPRSTTAPCLFMAPPFQVHGTASFAAGADPAQALQSALAGFMLVRDASVYDADGYMLGQGERIIVNGMAVQMATPSKRHIEAFAETAGITRRRARAVEIEEDADDMATPASATRAA
jgi:hypothetical protein